MAKATQWSATEMAAVMKGRQDHVNIGQYMEGEDAPIEWYVTTGWNGQQRSNIYSTRAEAEKMRDAIIKLVEGK